MEIISKIFLYVIIVISSVFHEFAHAWMAFQLGDSTAKNEGRLTLNPLVHLDPMGTVFLPLLFLFTFNGFIGWAKPVPYNPHMLRDQRYGSLKVALAGPLANILIAIFLGLVVRFASLTLSASLVEALSIIIFINLFLALFNLIPLPPLDGSKVFADLFPNAWVSVMRVGPWGVFAAILIAFYFLSPVARFLFKIIVGHGFGF